MVISANGARDVKLIPQIEPLLDVRAPALVLEEGVTRYPGRGRRYGLQTRGRVVSSFREKTLGLGGVILKAGGSCGDDRRAQIEIRAGGIVQAPLVDLHDSERFYPEGEPCPYVLRSFRLSRVEARVQFREPFHPTEEPMGKPGGRLVLGSEVPRDPIHVDRVANLRALFRWPLQEAATLGIIPCQRRPQLINSKKP